MGRITRDYLRAHRLCPQQCASNFFRILGAIDALDRHLGLGLNWYNIVHLYEGHLQTGAGFYLKSRSDAVKLISCLPKSNKGMKDDYLIVSGPWHDGLPCPTQLGEPGGVPQIQVFLTLNLGYLLSTLLCLIENILFSSFILSIIFFFTQLQTSDCLVILFNR